MLTTFIAAMMVASSGQAKGRNPGLPDTRTVSIENFDELLVHGPFKVTVVTGKALSVSLSGPRTMLDDTDMRVRDGRLIIGWQEGANWSRNGDHGVDIAISVPGLRSALIGEAGSIEIDNIEGDIFDATVPSAGQMLIHFLKVKKLKALLAGSGTLRVDSLGTEEIVAVSSGSGGMRLLGETDKITLVLSGSGSFLNAHLIAKDAIIQTAMSGSVLATVVGTAKINAKGSGHIKLVGGAECAISNDGSSKINCS